MRYAIVSLEWAKARGIVINDVMRKSIDGKLVVLHLDFLVPYEGEVTVVYESTDPAFVDLLQSEAWTEATV